MNVIIENSQNNLTISTDKLQKIVESIIAFEGHRCDEVSVHLVNKKEISELHQDYFDDPTPTDCISFPMDGVDAIGYSVLGDIFVCPEVAIEYVETNGGNKYQETTLYVIHGLLHLMGYDDIQENDIMRMRAAEKKHQDNLKSQNLILSG